MDSGSLGWFASPTRRVSAEGDCTACERVDQLANDVVVDFVHCVSPCSLPSRLTIAIPMFGAN